MSNISCFGSSKGQPSSFLPINESTFENIENCDSQSIKSFHSNSLSSYQAGSKFSGLMVAGLNPKDIKKSYSYQNFTNLDENIRVDRYCYTPISIKKKDIKKFDVILYVDNRERKQKSDSDA